MKFMKTWEVLKELTENPNKRFRLPSWEDGRYITATNTGLIVNEILELANVSRLKVDWEILPQEVTWQEALEAWANGKTVKCTARGYDNIYQKYDVVDDCDDSFLLDEVGNPLDAYEILEGKWYILEGEE